MTTVKNFIIEEQAQTLSSRHPRLRLLIETIGKIDIDLPKWKSVEDAIVYSVIGQMLSGLATQSIISKLIKQFDKSTNIVDWCIQTKHIPGPLFGVSQRKRKAIAEWGEFIIKNGKVYNRWPEMTLEAYRNEITKIWGFGRWSSDMIAIFFLGRLDVWPETDAGIKRACYAVFEKYDVSFIEKYIRNCETVTALYLWELLNRNLISDFMSNLNNG